MNSIDINEIDKSQFKCYKFPDGSIYFGEVAYLDEYGNLVNDLEKYNDDMMKKLKLMRHGLGVQLFGVTDNSSLCRYEGYWVKDKKNGQGTCFFPDKSVYDGTFAEDLFDGYGKFSWSNNDIYIGEWKEGRMDGEGEFKHNDGHILKGKFRNNYHFDKERFLNPFMAQEELIRFKIKNKEFNVKLKSENEKFSINNVITIKKLNELNLAIETTIQENKTPLIIRESKCLIKKEEIYKHLNKDFREIDLRLLYIKLRESNPSMLVLDELKSIVEECMNEGKNLFLNFDDCCIKYEELFDPDIKEFYGNSMLSPFLWTPQVFCQEKCWHNHLNNTNYKLDKNFKFIVYSKYVIQDSTKEFGMIEILKNRFEKSLPLVNVNVIIISE